MADNFDFQSVSDLQKYLKERGVSYGGKRKVELLRLCKAASTLGIQCDPDGLCDNREIVIQQKLTTPNSIFLKNPGLCEGSNDLSVLPYICLFDLYTFLKPFYLNARITVLK